MATKPKKPKKPFPFVKGKSPVPPQNVKKMPPWMAKGDPDGMVPKKGMK